MPRDKRAEPIHADDAMRFIDAVRKNDINLVKSMIGTFGPAIIDTPDSLDETALATAAWLGRTDIATLLVDTGANIEKVDGMGRTPLLCAVRTNNIPIVALLLESGADTSTRDENGRTPSMLAQHHKHQEIIDLLRTGPDPAKAAARKQNRHAESLNRRHAAQIERLRHRRPSGSPFKKDPPRP